RRRRARAERRTARRALRRDRPGGGAARRAGARARQPAFPAGARARRTRRGGRSCPPRPVGPLRRALGRAGAVPPVRVRPPRRHGRAHAPALVRRHRRRLARLPLMRARSWLPTFGLLALALGCGPMDVSNVHAHTGSFAAALTITAGPDDTQESTSLARAGDLPAEAYYSAWYYLPRSVSVGTFWVLFKFRQRTNADDAATATELYDM